ncbi:MAG: DUF3090 family protein [Acidimicrobiaceae bacterium]|nr:DUF3090 family protein [Acidimicrobiaceae bacterium]
MKYEFDAPDRVMVGVRGEVGARLFLLQARQGRRLVILKCEKLQLAALAQWISQVLDDMGRPGHLPDDLTLEPEYEVDFSVGDIAIAVDEERDVIEVTFESIDQDDDTATITLTKEWAGGLAIAITRLVEAGRPACPLCGGPLDPRGHDCPRTNGHRAPVR